MGEGDDPAARRGEDPELLATDVTKCPYDEHELINELGVLDLNFTRNRRCPKCGRRFWSSPMSDFAASLNQKLLPAWMQSQTLPRLESAQAETGKLEHKLDELQEKLAEVQKELPAPNLAVAAVREELGGLETRLGEMGRSLEEARQELLGLIPDATDLAYLKLAKAEVAEVRGLLTRHLEDDHRRRTLAASGRSNWLAWIAIVVAIVGVAVALITK